MKRMIAPLILAAAAFTTTQAFADDSSSMNGTKMSHKQMMQDCVTKAKAMNSSLSNEDAVKVCKDKVKTQAQQTTSGAPKDGQTDPK